MCERILFFLSTDKSKFLIEFLKLLSFDIVNAFFILVFSKKGIIYRSKIVFFDKKVDSFTRFTSKFKKSSTKSLKNVLDGLNPLCFLNSATTRSKSAIAADFVK